MSNLYSFSSYFAAVHGVLDAVIKYVAAECMHAARVDGNECLTWYVACIMGSTSTSYAANTQRRAKVVIVSATA